MQNKLLKTGLLVLAVLVILSGAGCELTKRFTLLLHGTYEVPTPYITPVARGSPAGAIIRPFPHETPVFEEKECTTTAGKTYFTEAQALYQRFRTLRAQANKASREDLPPIIDEMREIHGQSQALKPPADCEIFVVLATHIEAEMDQTIRAFIAFRNLEPEETWKGYLNEMLLHCKKIEELLEQVR